MKSLCFLSLFSILVIAGCDTAGIAETEAPEHSASSHKAVKFVPVKGDVSGFFPAAVVIPVDCTPLPARGTELEGNLSHFGTATINATGCGDASNFPDLTFTGGKGVITAANGDEATFDWEAEVTASGQCGVPGIHEHTWTITGGTGRFEDASGEFSVTGINYPFLILDTGEICPPSDPPRRFAEFSIDGHISSVGTSGN